MSDGASGGRLYGLLFNGERKEFCVNGNLCLEVPVTTLELKTAPGVTDVLDTHLPWAPLDMADFPQTLGRVYSSFTSSNALPGQRFWEVDYHLTGSSLSVPEPGSAGFMLLGLAAMGGLMQRGRRSAGRAA
ncbi:MAG: PEP-CTERM sorting domain-containing protein [Aquabacterium sp.]